MQGNQINEAEGMNDLKIYPAAINKFPFEDNFFKGVYSIEATCHVPNREDLYHEIFRVLKPDQNFACYEWCLTPLYKETKSHHCRIKKNIEDYEGITNLTTHKECLQSLLNVGFEVISIPSS